MKQNKTKKNRNKSWGIFILILILAIIVISILVSTFLKPVNKKDNLCGPTPSGEGHSLSYCDTSCKSDKDCKYECGCGPINKNENCNLGNMVYDCYGLMQVKCVSNKCIA